MLNLKYGQQIPDQQLHLTYMCILTQVTINATPIFTFLVHFTSTWSWLFQFYVKFTIFRKHEQSHLDFEWRIQTLFKTGIPSRVIL